MWQYIRENNIQCATLEQVKRARSIQQESFPFVPGSLRAKIVSVDGESATTPSEFQYQLAFDVRDLTGRSLLQWQAPWPSVYGRRLELAWPGATAEDQATLDAEGGVFETPPYLVDLKPSLRLDGVTAIDGQSIGSADDIEIYGHLTPPAGQATNVLFQGQAGEPNVFAIDLGTTPQQRLDELQAALNAAGEASNDAEAEANTLALIGATYMNILSRDLDDLAEWKWQRVLELGTFGTVIQSGDVQTTIGGSPLSFSKGPLVTDVATMPLGTFPADGTQGYGIETFELVGSQSSYLEGTALDMIVPDETMTAVTFLTRAARNGQQLQKVDSGNVESVLAAVDIGEAVEQDVREAVGQGKIAWVAETELQINQWRGSGYIIEDPSTGAAGYLGTGGYGVGSGTGGDPAGRLRRLLGDEAWLALLSGPWGDFLKLIGFRSTQVDSQHGDPVNLVNGNFWRQEVDLQIPALGLPVSWARTYNSQSTYTGPFGIGWTFTYGVHLSELPNSEDLVFVEDDGTEHLLTKEQDGVWLGPAAKNLTLKLVDGVYELLLEDLGIRNLFSLDGRLIRQKDPIGNTVTLIYGLNGLLESVEDASSTTVLSISWENGKIASVTDLEGRRIEYGYQGEHLSTRKDVLGKEWSYSYAGDRIGGFGDPLGKTTLILYDREGRCRNFVDVDGNSTRYDYSQGEVVVTNPLGYQEIYGVDELGHASWKADSLGVYQEAVWGEEHKLQSWLDASGSRYHVEYTDSGLPKKITGPTDLTFEYGYEAETGRLEWIKNERGVYSEFLYTDQGQIREEYRVEDGERSLSAFYEYDSKGRRTVAVEDGRRIELSYEYEADTRENAIPTLVQGLEVGVQTLVIDDLGQVVGVEVRDTNGRRVAEGTIEYHPNGQVRKMVDSKGNEMSLDLDDLGRTSKLTTSNIEQSYSYDAAGRTTKIAGNGKEVTWLYDALGRLLEHGDESGVIKTSYFDSVGRPLATVDAEGNTWTVEYCAGIGGAGCPGCPTPQGFCELVDPLGNITSQEFDEYGRLAKIQTPDGAIWQLEYDDFGQMREVIDPTGFALLLERDLNGRPTAVFDQDNKKTEYSYSISGQLESIKDAKSNLWSWEHLQAENRTIHTDPLGHATTWLRDSRGELLETTKADGSSLLYGYSTEGALESIFSGGQAISQFIYDSEQRLKTAENAESVLNFEYFDSGRVKKKTDDLLGQFVAYEYDSAGRVTEISDSIGVTSFRRDTRGLVHQVQDSRLGTFEYEYDPLGRRALEVLPTGLTHKYSYHSNGDVKSHLIQDSDGNILDGWKYGFDLRGRRTSKERITGDQEIYGYDAVGRLETIEGNDGVFQRFSYDQVGNRATRETNSGVEHYEYDDANRLETISHVSQTGETAIFRLTWNDNGELLARETENGVIQYEYTPLGQLGSITREDGSTVSFGYGPLGDRVRITDSTYGERRVLNRNTTGLSESHLVFDSATNEAYRYSPGVFPDEPLGYSSSSDMTYFHRDALKSVTGLSDSEGNLVRREMSDPFGRRDSDLSQSGPLAQDFTGRERVASTDLSYYRARYYDSEVGRFVSKDVYVGAVGRPSSHNQFTYVENDPVNLVDPSGNVINYILAGVYYGAAFAMMTSLTAYFYLETRYMHGDVVGGNPDNGFTPNLRGIVRGLVVYSLNMTGALVFGVLWAAILVVMGYNLLVAGPGTIGKGIQGLKQSFRAAINASVGNLVNPYGKLRDVMLSLLCIYVGALPWVTYVTPVENNAPWQVVSAIYHDLGGGFFPAAMAGTLGFMGVVGLATSCWILGRTLFAMGPLFGG